MNNDNFNFYEGMTWLEENQADILDYYLQAGIYDKVFELTVNKKFKK